MYNLEGFEALEEASELGGLFGGLIGIGIGLIIALLVILLPILILYIIARWKMFKKAGKKGWEAIVPVYGDYVMVEIAELNWWYFLALIAGTIFSVLGISLGVLPTLLTLAANFFVFYNLALKFKKEPVLWGILGALFSPIMVMILGFSSKNVYDASIKVSKNGPIK